MTKSVAHLLRTNDGRILPGTGFAGETRDPCSRAEKPGAGEKRSFGAFGRAKPGFAGYFLKKKEKSFEFLRNSSCQTGQWVV